MKFNRNVFPGAAVGAVLGGFIFGVAPDKILLGAIVGSVLGSLVWGWKDLRRVIAGTILGGVVSTLVLYPFLRPEHKSADLERLTFYIFGVGLGMLAGAGVGAVWHRRP
jgi:hypothetical protein